MSEQDAVNEELAAEAVGLHSLKPAPGPASATASASGAGTARATARPSGRGHKGYGSRAGAKDRARFEGGQNPIHMRMRKLRGPNKKMSMPFEPFRTHTQHVNLDDLDERASTTARPSGLEELRDTGLAKKRDIPVKILGRGELSKKLTVSAHKFSKSARERIEAAGGVCVIEDLSWPPSDLDDPQLRSASRRSARSSCSRRRSSRCTGLGSYIPVPRVNLDAVDPIQQNFGGGGVLNLLNTFTGGGLSRISLFALGIMPYITASIILQLLTVVSPALEKLQKEGEVGQARITQYTRYLTVGLAAAQAIGYTFLFRSQGSSAGTPVFTNFSPGTVILVVLCLTAGSVLVMWMGELITQRGIGNGISLMIFASIVARLPARHPVLVDQPGPGLQDHHAVPRHRRGGGRGVHPGGPAPDPDPVRQARDRPPHELRRADLPAAAREHGRRHPGHLRRVDHGVPADDRAADPVAELARHVLQPGPLGLRGRRDRS